MSENSESALRAFLSTRGGSALAAAVLLGALALALFVGLDHPPSGRISEQRCLHVVRAMLRTGNWLVPELRGKPRLQKPPLFYWAGATVSKQRGGETSFATPWDLRVVSASAALGLAALVFAWGRAIAGPGVGLLAAALLAAMLQFLSSARRGDAEMLLAFLATAALFAFDRLDAQRRRALLPVFAGVAGLAILTKATAVVFAVALPILVYLWLRRELRVLRDPGVIATCAAALALGLSWYVAILIFVPGAFETLGHALVLPMGGKGSRGDSTHFRAPWWYLTVLPVRAAPASLVLPFVIWRLWRTRVYRDEPRMRFAALCFLVPFAAFSLLPQKQKHYTLAMLPGLALCSAEALCAAARELRPRLALFLRALGTPLALAGLAGAVLCALFYHWVEGSSLASLSIWSGVPILFLAGALAGALLARPASFGAGIFVGLLLVVATYRAIAPARSRRSPRPRAALARRARAARRRRRATTPGSRALLMNAPNRATTSDD